MEATGVLVEASPHNYRALVRNRPTDANVLMAACDSDGDVVDFLDRGGGIAGLVRIDSRPRSATRATRHCAPCTAAASPMRWPGWG